MTYMKKTFSLILILCLLLTAAATAFADDVAGTSAVPAEAELPDWDAAIEQFVTEHGISADRVTMGYYNFATGEEHYFSGDKYLPTASMYKLATSMYYLDLVDAGEIKLDDIVGGYKLEKAIYQSIVYSDNDVSQAMWLNLGNWEAYRKLVADYYGVDINTVDKRYFKNYYNTPKEMINLLRTLYDDIDGKYELIYTNMKLAHPGRYFLSKEQSCELGHKYGFIVMDGSQYVNDCAIVMAEQPIAIVMFTQDIARVETVLADYCALMIEYCSDTVAANRVLAEKEAARLAEEEAKAAEELAAKNAEEKAAMEARLQAEAEAAQQKLVEQEQAQQAKIQKLSGLYFLIAVLAVGSIALVIYLSRKRRIKAFWGLMAAALFCAGLALCVRSAVSGYLYVSPSGSPEETVSTFWDSFISGEYETAYAQLGNYSGLGIENQPSEPDGALLREVLLDSYSYTITPGGSTDGLSAVVYVDFTHLNIPLLASKLSSQVDLSLEKLMENRSNDQIYNGSNGYSDEFVSEVYNDAFAAVLGEVQAFYITEPVKMQLNYVGGSWRIFITDDIVDAIGGNIVH